MKARGGRFIASLMILGALVVGCLVDQAGAVAAEPGEPEGAIQACAEEWFTAEMQHDLEARWLLMTVEYRDEVGEAFRAQTSSNQALSVYLGRVEVRDEGEPAEADKAVVYVARTMRMSDPRFEKANELVETEVWQQAGFLALEKQEGAWKVARVGKVQPMGDWLAEFLPGPRKEIADFGIELSFSDGEIVRKSGASEPVFEDTGEKYARIRHERWEERQQSQSKPALFYKAGAVVAVAGVTAVVVFAVWGRRKRGR